MSVGTIPTPGGRHYFLDWIRVLCLVLLFVFHVGRIYDGLGFYVEAQEPSQLVLIFGQLTLPWHMPLLFLVSGAVTALLLQRKSRVQFFKERMKRLAIPLLAGIPLLAFPQTIFALKFRNPQWTWTQAWSEAVASFLTVTDLTGFRGGFTPAHLWFLFALIILSVTALIAGSWFRPRQSKTETSSWVRDFLIIASLILGAGLARAIVNAEPFNPLVFGLYFYLGFALTRTGFSSAFLNARGLLTSVLLIMSSAVIVELASDPRAIYHQLFLGGAYGMSFTLWVLAITKRWLAEPRPLLRHINEAVMPVYLLHQLFIVAIGFFIVNTGSQVREFLMILFLSVIVTIVTYVLIVRQSNTIRWLFGMSPKSTPT